MNKKATLKQCLGIDVSMKKIDCCLSFYTQELKVKVVATSGFENNPDGFIKLREWLNRKQDNGLALHINMEATGTYHEEAAYFLAGVGYPLSVIQPGKGKQYAKSLDEKNKTDKIDAGMLARMGLERELSPWNRPNEKLRLLKRMSRERISLIRDRNALTNQLHALDHSFEALTDSVERLKERIALATKQLGQVEVQMREMVESDTELSVNPTHFSFVAVLTIVGGTVGGYITFAGAHRLLDAGLSGEQNLPAINKGALSAVGLASLMRILLFIAALGVVSAGGKLDPANPAASVFQLAAGAFGYKLFGLVMWLAGISSVVGSAYTSVSFIKSFHPVILKFNRQIIICFIIVSTIIFLLIGKPVKILLTVGAINGFILPISLGIMLIAAYRSKIISTYKQPL